MDQTLFIVATDGVVLARLDTAEEVCEMLAHYVKQPEDLARWLDDHQAALGR